MRKMNKKRISDEQMKEEFQRALHADPRDVKVSITVRLDSDIYLELKHRATMGDGDGKYQRLLNELLRENLFQHPKALEERMDLLEKEVQNLKKVSNE